MRSYLALILLVHGVLPSKGQTVSVSRQTAAISAAYINKEKKVILFCQDCPSGKRRINVKDAEVVEHNERYAVRLHGYTADKIIVNELVLLEDVYVKKGRQAVSLAKVLNINCSDCHTNLNWSKMEPMDTDRFSNGFSDKNHKAIALITNTLTGRFNVPARTTIDGDTFETEKISCTYDTLNKALRIVYLSTARAKYVCSISMNDNLLASDFKKGPDKSVSLSYRDDNPENDKIWYTVFNYKGELTRSGTENKIVVSYRSETRPGRLKKAFRQILK